MTRWLGHVVVLAIAGGKTLEREARALAELARGGPHHELALEVLASGPHAVRFAVELAEAVLGPTTSAPKLVVPTKGGRR